MYFFQPDGNFAEQVFKISDINDNNYMIYEDKYNIINNKPKELLYFLKNKNGNLTSYYMNERYKTQFKDFHTNNKINLIPTDKETANHLVTFNMSYELNNPAGNEIYLNLFRQAMTRNIDLSMTVWDFDEITKTFKVFNNYLNFPITTDFDNYTEFALNISDLDKIETVKFRKWNGFLDKTEIAYNKRDWAVIFYLVI